MKADNIFKFVSVRPPRTVDFVHSYGERGAQGISDVTEWIAKALAREESKGLSDEDARANVASTVVNSVDYFSKDQYWSSLLIRWASIAQIVKMHRAAPDLHKFKSDVMSFLAEVYGGEQPYDAFMKSEQFNDLKRKIWRSYLGSVMKKTILSREQRDIARGLRFVWLLEHTGSEDDFAQALRGWNRFRPSVPRDVLPTKSKPPEAAPTVSPTDDKKEAAAAYGQWLKRLTAAKKFLQELERKKRAVWKSSSVELKGEKGQLPDAELKAAVAKHSEGIPWRVSKGDLAQRPETEAVLRELDLDPHVMTNHALVEEIEARIAFYEAEVAELHKQSRVTNIGKVLTRINR